MQEWKSDFQLLKRASEEEITNVLGRPHKIELYERGQKFFYYHLDCNDKNEPEKILKIRITALGVTNEVLILSL